MLGIPVLYLAVAGLAAAAIIGVAVGVYVFINPSRTAKDRLEDLTAGTVNEAAVPSFNSAGTSAQMAALSRLLTKVAAPSTEDETNALRRHLVQAGYRARNNIEVYSAIRFSTAVLLPMCFLVVVGEMSTLKAVGIGLALALFGYYIPALLVTNTRTKRQDVILRTFPDALDMLVASVEAGLGLDAALKRLADEMGEAAPDLVTEIRLTNSEIGAGMPRAEALGRLEYRTGLEEIGQLVNVLVQAERFGTPVARSLRIHAELVRTRRMQRAEEAAAKISPKLTVAMILFMLPCLVAILIGPAAIRIIRTLAPAMSGTN